MSTRGDILRRAAQVESDAVPEPWRPSDDEDALATVSDRAHYRTKLVPLPDGAGEVPAYVWDFSRTPTIPNDVREEWTRSSAGRVLGPNGKYVSRGSDVPRLSYDGNEPGLLVEAVGRTNQVPNSADLSAWDNQNGVSISPANSILSGETAHKVNDTDGSPTSRIQEFDAGFTNSTNAVSCIMEEDTAIESAVRLEYSGGITEIEFTWGGNSLIKAVTNSASNVNANVRTLTQNGPNGGKVVRLVFTFDEADSDSITAAFVPDNDGNGDSAYFHHMQIEGAPNASSPIVTQGSPVTRAGDDYAIFEGGQPSWWNPNEGTLIVTFSWQSYERGGSTRLVSDGPNARHLSIGGGFGIFSTDSRNTTGEVGTLTPFGLDRFALSFGQQDIILSVNGSSNNAGGHDGNLLSAQNLQIGEMDNLNGRFEKLLYTPRALPESTLNAITS